MSTVNELLEAGSLRCSGSVSWGKRLPNDTPGVYIVSLSFDPDKSNGFLATAPIDHRMLAKWLERSREFKLDGKLSPSPEAVARRLSEYWLPDESILYIGQTSKLRTRMNQFYRHELGMKGSHSGGQWLKTLSALNTTFVHYAESLDPELSEYRLMQAFMVRVSERSRMNLRNNDRPYPFANLEHPKLPKQHGISQSPL